MAMDDESFSVRWKRKAEQADMESAEIGTISRDHRYDEAFLNHRIDDVTYKTKLSTLRGDFQKPDGSIDNQLRKWGKEDFTPLPGDLLQERLYCVQWRRPKSSGKGYDYEFRAVTEEDLYREKIVEDYITKHLTEWQISKIHLHKF